MGQYFSRRLTLSVLSVLAFFAFALRTQATQISGTIYSTLPIAEDSELVGDVTCMVVNGPCIVIGASHVKLRLNGYTIAGTISGCTPSTSSDDAIDVIGEQDVAILGPGLVQG